jgi:hypothetical protein
MVAAMEAGTVEVATAGAAGEEEVVAAAAGGGASVAMA